jgi:hypothetical protein
VATTRCLQLRSETAMKVAAFLPRPASTIGEGLVWTCTCTCCSTPSPFN